jgi:homocitrate synthase
MKHKLNFKGVIDTTLREGQQSPLLFDAKKYLFSLDEKKKIVEHLVKLGVRYIEFFSPVVVEQEEKDFLELKEYIRALTDEKVYLLAHCRCHEEDIRRAIDLGFDGLNIYLGASAYAQKYGHGKNFAQILDIATRTFANIRAAYPNIYLRFSGEDSFRTPLRDIFAVYDKIYPYVDTFGMPDTVGYATPQMVKQRVRALGKRYPNASLEAHFHNDRGFALANAQAAIEAGAQFIDTTIWGLGERSGITSITGFLLNLYKTDEALCASSYNIDYCYQLNMLMQSILALPIPYTEPVSLMNRSHIAGVHQKAAMQNNHAYEAHFLDRFGVNNNRFLLGPLSGWNIIYHMLKNVYGYEVTHDQAKLISREFKQLCSNITDQATPEQVLAGVIQTHALKKAFAPLQLQE